MCLASFGANLEDDGPDGAGTLGGPKLPSDLVQRLALCNRPLVEDVCVGTKSAKNLCCSGAIFKASNFCGEVDERGFSNVAEDGGPRPTHEHHNLRDVNSDRCEPLRPGDPEGMAA